MWNQFQERVPLPWRTSKDIFSKSRFHFNFMEFPLCFLFAFSLWFVRLTVSVVGLSQPALYQMLCLCNEHFPLNKIHINPRVRVHTHTHKEIITEFKRHLKLQRQTTSTSLFLNQTKYPLTIWKCFLGGFADIAVGNYMSGCLCYIKKKNFIYNYMNLGWRKQRPRHAFSSLT